MPALKHSLSVTHSQQPLLLSLIMLYASGCGSTGEPDGSPSPAATESPVAATPTPTPIPAHETPAITDSSLVVVPDNGSNQVKVVGVDSGRLIYHLDLESLQEDLCGSSQGCFMFGADHQDLDGHDYIDVSYGLTVTMGNAGGFGIFDGNIDRVQLTTPPTLRWRLTQLNFSGLPGGASAYCAADPADPCKPDPTASEEAQALCRLGDAHDFQVLSDDPVAQRAELLVPDTDYFRMMKISLDYSDGNTCGTVESYVDHRTNPDWSEYAQPNHLIWIEREGGQYALLTQRSITGDGGALNGLGVLQLWELTPDQQFIYHWTFPEATEAGQPSFMLPHGGELVENGHPEGDLIRFADSASLTTALPDTSGGPAGPPVTEGGSISVLLLRDLLSPPDYLYDLYQAGDNVWGFPRFGEEVGDGTVMVTDSGCVGPMGNCPYQARILWLNEVDYGNSALGGYWTETQDQLVLNDQTSNIVRTLDCGFISPFWAQTIHPEDIGQELAAAQASGGQTCPR